jgi:WD40 repeat protein
VAFRAQRLADESLIKEREARAAVSLREASLRRELYAGDMADVWQAWNDGEIDRARTILDRYTPASTSNNDDLREFSWHFLHTRCNNGPTLLGGHDAPILTAAMSPNGRLLASADRAGTVKIWDLESRRELATWNYSQKEVTSVKFSPDGSVLATAGQDATIRLWDVDDWTEIACLRGHENTVCAVNWSPDGQRLVSGARDNSIRIWNAQSKQEEKCLADNGDVVRCVVWLPDGTRVAAAVGQTVRTWRVEDWQPEAEIAAHRGGVLSLAISPDGKYLASGGYIPTVVISDLTSNKEIIRSPTMTGIWSLSFSPDGRYLLAASDRGGPSVWQLRAAEHQLDPIRVGVERTVASQRAALLDPTGELLVTVSEEDRQIRLGQAREIYGHSFVSFPENCLTVDMKRNRAICGDEDGSVVIRSFPSGELRSRLRGHVASLRQAALSTSNRWLATIAVNDEVLLWDLDSLQLRHRFNLPDSSAGDELGLSFSSDERLLGVGNNAGIVRIWRIAQGKLLRDLYAPSDSQARIAFAPNGQIFATAVGWDGGSLWNVEIGAKIAPFCAGLKVWDLCFSPDSSKIFAAADVDGAIGCDIPSGKEAMRLARHRGSVYAIAVSPDGQTLATLASDNSIRLWHVPTGRELFTLFQHTCKLRWLAFASPTKLLVGSSLDDGSPVGVFVFDAADSRSHQATYRTSR